MRILILICTYAILSGCISLAACYTSEQEEAEKKKTMRERLLGSEQAHTQEHDRRRQYNLN